MNSPAGVIPNPGFSPGRGPGAYLNVRLSRANGAARWILHGLKATQDDAGEWVGYHATSFFAPALHVR